VARRAPTGCPSRLAGVPRPTTRPRIVRGAPIELFAAVVLATFGATVGGCGVGATLATPPIVAGRSEAPREVNLITRDYSFAPATLDLVPGETILLHVINGGLEIHEAVIGDASVQAAWETAEAATVGAPPGPTPVVEVPADVAGVRVVVRSGERMDLDWTVPAIAAGAWIVGCHIPGHWAKGMQIPVRWVVDGAP
jgi:uncharacterized cupredoxin-like copper-binding protein